jgi:GntR family transcriptional regulator, transcriptional repressor for pyruvate dehydrogenase complex
MMTRHQTSSAAKSTAAQSLLRPLRPSRNLTEEVAERIAAEIRTGSLAPGARLPTEAELVAAMGVSRTVVREAVAALRADGLVITRQGLGAFVASDSSRAAFRISSGSVDGPPAISEILRVMELRLAVEAEAAALAAERATKAQLSRVKAALQAIDRAIAARQSAVQEDVAFHRAIAEATGNQHFPDFLAFLGRHVIPRQMVRLAHTSGDEQSAYLDAIQRDHVAIAKAIGAGDATGARKAMRDHLSNSISRYRALVALHDTE